MLLYELIAVYEQVLQWDKGSSTSEDLSYNLERIKEVSEELNDLDSELITNYSNLDLTFQEYSEIMSTLRHKKGN